MRKRWRIGLAAAAIVVLAVGLAWAMARQARPPAATKSPANAPRPVPVVVAPGIGAWPPALAGIALPGSEPGDQQQQQQQQSVVVAGASKRAVVMGASYEARAFGVRSAMPLFEAQQLCPELVVVRPASARYREASRAVHGIFRRFAPRRRGTGSGSAAKFVPSARNWMILRNRQPACAEAGT